MMRPSFFTACLKFLFGYLGVVMLVIAFAAFLNIRINDNFAVLTPGAVYRSGQLPPTRLDHVLRTYSIRSVLNLRGRSSSRWYAEEIEACGAAGVEHYDRKLSARKFVTPSDLGEIIELIRVAPKPILIHCNGGADRTGLVAAAWRIAGEHATPHRAEQELSLWRGHAPFFIWKKSAAMDESFRRFTNSQKH